MWASTHAKSAGTSQIDNAIQAGRCDFLHTPWGTFVPNPTQCTWWTHIDHSLYDSETGQPKEHVKRGLCTSGAQRVVDGLPSSGIGVMVHPHFSMQLRPQDFPCFVLSVWGPLGCHWQKWQHHTKSCTISPWLYLTSFPYWPDWYPLPLIRRYLRIIASRLYRSLGWWKGSTIKGHIRKELHTFTEGISRDMKQQFKFVNISEGGISWHDPYPSCYGI